MSSILSKNTISCTVTDNMCMAKIGIPNIFASKEQKGWKILS